MFFRIATDGVRTPINLRNQFAGPTRTACWIIGGGPSLGEAPVVEIASSPAPKFAINLAGAGLLRPSIWTSYDPTVRFHRSIYLDPSILKLVALRRATDLVPESTYKVCECPNLLFFEREPQRGFHDFPGGPPLQGRVADWQDSMIQAIELAWWLGFRRLFLIGCEMRIEPEPEHRRVAADKGVEYRPNELLRTFYDRCRGAGLSAGDLESVAPSKPYHFDETKPIAAAIQTDFHYFRVTQYLRLSRRSMALAGLELTSCTPGSRLNGCFPFRESVEVLAELRRDVGDPAAERTFGRYSLEKPVESPEFGPMKDFRPHNWPTECGVSRPAPDEAEGRRARARRAAAELPEIAVELDEAG